MKNTFCNSKMFSTLTLMLTAAFGFGPFAAAQDNSQYTAEPAIVQTTELSPKVLLSMSLDHQLFIKAYNDYDNIYDDPSTAEDNGKAETTYEHRYKYVGYFDNTKCYAYGDGLFTSIGSAAVDGYCTDTTDDDDNAVSGGWSGNFLNWLTMTRIDLVRYVLYGGYRSTDNGDETDEADDGVTVLERSYLPNDAHSYAKYYQGTDIDSLTDGLPAGGCAADTAQCSGYTFCNTSKPPSTDVFSQSVDTLTSPPLLRVIKGDYSLWASGERFQCLANSEYSGIAGLNDTTGESGNAPAATGITAFGSSPENTTNITDMIVRVRVCENATGAHSCKQYGDYFKPTGLLHEYGEAGSVEFGLLTGSYISNKDSGVLRSNVASFTREINPETGQFHKPENSIVANLDAFRIVDYRFNAGANSGSYFGGSGVQDCRYGQFSFNNGYCRNWGNPFSEILAESYRYFSGAATPTPVFRGDTAIDYSSEAGNGKEATPQFLRGLSVDTWPTSNATEDRFSCSNLSVLGFNASTASYDDNRFYNGDTSISVTDLLGFAPEGEGAAKTVAELTDVVGNTPTHGELLGSHYFVGNVVGGETNNECSAKPIEDAALSTVRGTCPEAPRLEGTYLSAGLAHYFHTTAKRKISTYGVTMAGATPNISIQVSDAQQIVLIPACRNKGDGTRIADPGRCALAAFKAIGETTATSGKYMIGWEDTEQGGDYDLDLWGVLEYSYTANDGLIIDTKLIHESTGNELDFGFIISGTQTDKDGSYYPSKIDANGGTVLGSEDEEVDSVETASDWCTSRAADASPSCVDSTVAEGGKTRHVQTMAFTVNTLGGSTAGLFLQEPLYYASKWGSFSNKGGGDPSIPDSLSEWKIADEDGNYNELSGYTSVSDPAKLTVKMRQILKSLLDRPNVSTATGVSLSSATGVGVLVNSLYHPEIKSGDNKVDWVGSLTGILRDFEGYIREDAPPYNGYVDSSDLVIQYGADNSGQTRAVRSRLDANGDLTVQDTIDVESVRPLWDAQLQLAAIGADANYIAQTNNSYNASAASRRYILTGSRPDGATQVLATQPFTAANIDSFGDKLGTGLDKEKLVNYIRGVEDASMRSRTLDGTKYLLGDTVNSTPKVVGPPSANYNNRKNDLSYIQYLDKYQKRRQVVYVGGNDGMLHAFNAGFLNSGSIGFNAGAGVLDNNGSAVTQHPLGSELWSYVPYNLLPHLQWLASPDYSHVFYMDGDIQEFDVNIFADDGPDGVYPGGWGTIIVAGMRLGGGEITADGETFRSAYVIMDVTDPEQPPKLIAEVTHADLGFTTSNVQLMVNRTPRSFAFGAQGVRTDDDGNIIDPKVYTAEDLSTLTLQDIRDASAEQLLQLSSLLEGLTEEELDSVETSIASLIAQSAANVVTDNQWYLVFGSGPNVLSTATSTQSPKLFTFNLASKVLTSVDFNGAIEPAISNAFVGGVTVVDWESDFTDDAIYFGLVENSEIPANGDVPAQPIRGRLMQASIDFDDSSIVIAPTQLLTGFTDYPFSTEPVAVADGKGNRWVYAGTGRFYVSGDGAVEGANAYLGVVVDKVNTVDYADVAASSLLNVTDVRLYINPSNKNDNQVLAINDSDVLDGFLGSGLSELNTYIASTKSGWIREFGSTTELVSENTAFASQSLFVTSYDPGATGSIPGECATPGASFGYVFDMFNGLPQINLRSLGVTGETSDTGLSAVDTTPVRYSNYASGTTITTGSKTIRIVPDPDDPSILVPKEGGSSGGGLVKDPDIKKDDNEFDEALPGRRSWREIHLDEVY